MAEKNTEKNVPVAGEATAAAEKKAPAPKVEIIRGRMPLPIVQMIKFAKEDQTDGALAAQFRTTNGKVSDIRKEANFGYVTKAYVPSAEDLAKAVVFAEQLDDKSILAHIKSIKPATPEQTAAFDAARKATRKVTVKPAAAPAEVSEADLENLTK